LLLIMGLGGSVEMWESLVGQLPGRRIVAFDAPGTGRSSLPMVPVSIPEMADLAAEVLSRQRIDAADILGFSYGGAIAQQFAVQHPTRVRRLVLVATTCGVGTQPAADPQSSAALASPWRYYSAEYFKRTAAVVYGGRVGRDTDVQSRLYRERAVHPPHPYGYFLQLASGSGWSSLPFLRRIGCPAMILVGDDDPLVPVEAARQVAYPIPDNRVIVLEGAGHLLLLDEPDRAAQAIEAFLSDVTPTCSDFTRPADNPSSCTADSGGSNVR
jgi:pimeloyl-ACP methyl ester carboxylesterase